MARAKVVNSSNSRKKMRPALTPEARENQLISLATDLAEQRLSDGTASSQEVVHFLRLGTSKNRLEIERLERENELLRAKTESLQNAQRSDEFYAKVLDAMRIYSGSGDSDDY